MNTSAIATHASKHLSDIVHRPPSELSPWPNNPRKHSAKQIVQLRAAIKEFGFTSALIVDEAGTVLSGHGRLEAALEMNLATVPTRVISGLTKAQKRAFVISDNKLGSVSTWDEVNLRSELELLIKEDYAIELTAFSTAEIDLMFEDPTPTATADPDDLRESDESPEIVTRVGDLWCLGHHKLLCGNSLERQSFERLLGDERIQLSFSDPPYNVRISNVVGKGNKKHAEFAMASGEMSPAEFTDFLEKSLAHVHEFSVDGALSYQCIDWRHYGQMLDAGKPTFGELKQLIVWAKPTAGMGTHYRSAHELILLFKKGQAPHINNFLLGQYGRYRTNVWNYPGSQQFKDKTLAKAHPTVKPAALVADALRDSSHRKSIVLDSFVGSGTILVAAERTGRYARAIELEPKYCDTGIRRWQRISGKQAFLDATGQTWDEVRAERLAALK